MREYDSAHLGCFGFVWLFSTSSGFVPPIRGLLPWLCPHLLVLQVLNVGGVVAVPVPTSQHTEPPPAHGVHQRPAVRQQLQLPDLQHAAVVCEAGRREGEKRGPEQGAYGRRDARPACTISKQGKGAKSEINSVVTCCKRAGNSEHSLGFVLYENDLGPHAALMNTPSPAEASRNPSEARKCYLISLEQGWKVCHVSTSA